MLFKLSTDKTVSAAAAALQTAVQANRFGVMQVHNLKETMTKKGMEFARECSERLHQLTELIDAERQCCPFLTLVLQVPAHKNALILEIKGPEGAKRLIRAELLVD